MDTEIIDFKVGTFNCKAVSDGTLTYAPPNFPPPAAFLCLNAPGERISQLLNEQGQQLEQWQEWTSSYTCLFIDTGRYRVLVDTGAGNLGPKTGKLVPNLRKAGIMPEDIDIVITTHAHPDHVGGNVNDEGRPVFPRARWVMLRDEWRFWTSDLAGQTLPEHGRDLLINIARKNLIPIKDKVDLLDKEGEIIQGINAINAPGHTPGQMALNISSVGEQLLYISDVVIHPFHLIEPGWYAAVDVAPDQVIQTRSKILQRAASQKALTMAFHFPFPGVGHIAGNENSWKWQAI